MASLEQLLAEHPFLEGMRSDHLQLVAEYAHQAAFKSGEHLLRENEEASEFYLIIHGKVALGTFIPGRGITTIQTLEDGELVGWSWLVPPYRWRFSALSISPVQTIALNGGKLREKCRQNHEFGFELTKRLVAVVGQRLTATRKRLED